MIPLFKVFMADNVMEYLQPVLHSGYIGEGNEVELFEKELQVHLNSPHRPISTNSCTSAINLVLLALGVGPGDEVITTPLTCIATNNSIPLLGARPVWADINEETGNIDPSSVAKCWSPRTKAIIAVDWTGRRCDYAALKSFNVPVIEDAAHGPYYNTMNCGDFVCLSFGPIKHLTCGDGGAIICNKPEYTDRLRKMRWYGLDRTSSKDFRCEQNIVNLGSKFHMNNISAAIGRANLRHLAKNIGLHSSNARYLDFHIKLDIKPPYDEYSDYWVFPLIIPNHRDKFIAYLNENGITASRVHARNDKHTALKYYSGPLYGVDEFDYIQVNIPCGWWLTLEDREYMVEKINSWKGYF